MSNGEERFVRIEERLAAIERALRLQPSRDPRPSPPPVVSPSDTFQPASQAPKASSPSLLQPPPTSAATSILGWGGMAAFVLATAYLIRLAMDAGWLTPTRQVGLAAIFGLALIASGFVLQRRYARYASLLPGCGIVVLFLTNYGAHLYHHLIGALPATVGVIVISLGALVLGRIFKEEWYALFAVLGSYTGPLLLPHLHAANPTDLVIYFSAWSILFCWYSIYSGQRRVYLLAAYFAFIVFDILWRAGGGFNWETAVTFQFIQLMIFVCGVGIYAVKHGPMDRSSAMVHIPVLLLFYFVQYVILKQHIPTWAPWIAFASLGLLLLAYRVVRGYLGVESPAGHFIVTAYAAVVLLHAGYLELFADDFRPWVGIAFIAGMGAYAIFQEEKARESWPLFAVAGVMFLHNYLRLVFGWNLNDMPGYQLLIPLYALMLYVGYWLAYDRPHLATLSQALLYMAHINVMAGAVQLFHNRLVVSFIWGVLAVLTLILAIRSNNKVLARSALFVFAASAMKVWLYDLSQASPLVRIGCLLILGVTLYLGGLLYQRIETSHEPAHAAPPVR